MSQATHQYISQYTLDSLKNFINENKKGFYKIRDINFVAFRCYLIDWKLYESSNMNINVCKTKKISLAKVPKDGIYVVENPHEYMLNQYNS